MGLLKRLSPRPPHKKDDDDDDDDDDGALATSGLDYFGSSWTPGKRSGSRQGRCTATRAWFSGARTRRPSKRPSLPSGPSRASSPQRGRSSASLSSRTSTPRKTP